MKKPHALSPDIYVGLGMMIVQREDDNRMAFAQNDCVKTEMNAAAL